MKAYLLKDGRQVWLDDFYTIDDEKNRMEGVRVKILTRKSNFSEIPQGEQHYDCESRFIEDKKDYVSLLFHKREGTTARKYVKKYGEIERVMM